MNRYELTYIIDTALEETARKELIEKFSNLITANGGEVEKVDETWGKRRLAYAINDKLEGYYVLVTMKAPADLPREIERTMGINENILRCLKAAAPVAEENGITLVVEPLNATDRPGYFIPEAGRLLSILNEVDSPNIKMLYDIYHQHMTGDFDLEQIGRNIHRIGHFHVADCPGRHEPGTGNVDYVSILRSISSLPYGGFIGLEYRAINPDEETLDFLKEV